MLKYFTRTASLLAVSAFIAFAPLDAFAKLRANYEVSLSENGSNWATRTAESIEQDQTIVQELGQFKVELLPIVAATGEYSLQVTVSRKPASEKSVVIPHARTFQGSLGGPLEFSAQFGEVTVSGAIMLHELRE